MLAHELKYEDFNGNEVTETFYFNLTKSELIKLQVSVEGGMQKVLQDIIDSQDVKSLVHEFEKIVLASYGVKSEDGKRFIKTEELREQFSQTAAYDALFSKIATDEKFAAEFILGTFPKDMDLKVALEEAKAANAKSLAPPVAPALPDSPPIL